MRVFCHQDTDTDTDSVYFFTVMLWAHGMEDTNTLSWDVYTYLFSLTHRQGDTRRHSLGIDTLTKSRKGVDKELGGRGVLWRKDGTL